MTFVEKTEYSVSEAAKYLGLTRARIFELIRLYWSPQCRTDFVVGRQQVQWLIPAGIVEDYVSRWKRVRQEAGRIGGLKRQSLARAYRMKTLKRGRKARH